MKKPSIVCLLFLGITLSPYAQKINSDAITAFWRMVDRLKKDQPLTDTVWNTYYNCYGNKNYMATNRSDDQVRQHRQYLEIVFRPSFADSLKKIAPVKNKTQGEDIFQNLYYIKLHEDTLRKYSREIASPAYLQTSIALAKKYLPANKYRTLPADLTVYIMAMTMDAAVQPPDMYFGIALLYDFDRFQKGAIAGHEFHHQLRVEKETKGQLPERDLASYSIIYQINNEGCADLVDKTVLLEHETAIFGGDLEKKWLFDSAGLTIKKLDSCLMGNAGSDTVFTTAKQFRKITDYSSGHMPGFYMTNIIKRNGLVRELIDGSDNPFNIFYLYNTAAKADSEKPPFFSEKTIDYLKKLEKQRFPWSP